MKRFIAGVVVGALLFAAPALAQSHIRMIVNGSEVVSDVPPQIIDGRVMVPVRFVSEQFGADVSWDNAGRAVTIRGGNLPDYVACEMFNVVKAQAESIQQLNEGLGLLSQIAAENVPSSQRQDIRDLAAAGKVIAQQAAQTEQSIAGIIADYCPESK